MRKPWVIPTLVTGIVITALVGVFLLATSTEARHQEPAVQAVTVDPLQVGGIGTTEYHTDTSFTPDELASALGLHPGAVLTVTQGALGCDILFDRPLKTLVNQVFDGQGNVISEEIIEVDDLDHPNAESERELFDDVMFLVGCGRETGKDIVVFPTPTPPPVIGP